MLHKQERKNSYAEKKAISSYYIVKRLMDILISAFLLIILSPLLVYIRYKMNKKEGRPILMRKSCIGKDGRPFLMLYFRTMSNPSRVIHAFPKVKEQPVPVYYYQHSQSIITPIGKWLMKYKLDRLPQLWNVLKGEMSLVGPEAKEPDHMTIADSNDLSMRPGLTGFSMTETGIKRRKGVLDEELYYCNYCSFKTDIRIAWKSVKKIITN